MGIETSCDETGAAVVRHGREVLSNTVVSSLPDHRPHGGIIPEIASRRHLEYIYPVVQQALREAGLGAEDIHAIAVTARPGLIGSLLVGISFARALSWAWRIPLIEVDHVQAHVYANFLQTSAKKDQETPTLPAIGLVVSGGHTSLYYLPTPQDFQLIGETRDDAAGEAFDKVGRILGLGYPGGPIIDRLGAKGRPGQVPLRCADLPGTFDFSFSGIKTGVLYHTRRHKDKEKMAVEDVCRAFQDEVVGVLVRKSLAACRRFSTRTLLVGGGVAANSALRTQLSRSAEQEDIRVWFPPLPLCLDNAAMIAGLGFHACCGR